MARQCCDQSDETKTYDVMSGQSNGIDQDIL